MAGPTGNAHQFLNLALCDGLAGRKANNRPHTLRPNVHSGSITSIWRCPDDFRFTPDSRHSSEGSALPKCAMCGRPRVGKSFFHVLQHWSVQPCVRPLNAVHMTAGHNALRGSGAGQKPHSRMLWHKWVVLIAGSTGSALKHLRDVSHPGNVR